MPMPPALRVFEDASYRTLGAAAGYRHERRLFDADEAARDSLLPRPTTTALISLDEPLTRAALPFSLLRDRSARSSAEADASVDDEHLSRRVA